MKVLVVEDEALVRLTVVDVLTDSDFDVIEAATGEEALARCEQEAPDVLFTDIRLPGQITGWDIAELCRANRPDLPVIYASGYSPMVARPVPGSVFFQKPYRPEHIVKAIRDLTRAHG